MECPHCGAPLAASYLEGDHGDVCPVCGGGLGAAPPPESPAVFTPPETSPETAEEPAPLTSWTPGTTEADLSGPAFVCLTEEHKLNPLAIGPLVEQFVGLGRADARHHVARCKGLIAEGLSLDTAQNFVAALREKGIGAFALSAGRAPSETREVHIARVYDAEDDALYMEMDAQGTVRSVPWAQVAAGLCTCQQFPGRQTVAVQVDRPRPVAGVGIRMGWVMDTETIHVDRPARPAVRVTLVFAGRPGVAHLVTFGEGDVRYAYLGARVLPAQHLNFGLLLGDIAAHCPHGFFPAGYRAAATGAVGRVPTVLGKQDYGHYVRWAICCAAAKDLFQTGGSR